jgi:hypothetical protein
MLRKIVASLAVAAAVGAFFSDAAAADDWQTTDCGNTDFRFDGSGFDVSCRHISLTGSNMINEKDDEFYVHDAADTMYVDLIDIRIVGGYVNRSGMLSDLRLSYDENFDDEWHETGQRDGYEMAEYQGRDDSDSPIDCIAFRRIVTLQYGGISRYVVGHGCSTKSVEKVYELLKQVSAPGG